jgi:hypothetical protein
MHDQHNLKFHSQNSSARYLLQNDKVPKKCKCHYDSTDARSVLLAWEGKMCCT